LRKPIFTIILLLIITAGLGATAIWISNRLSKEKEVTPEEGEAYREDLTQYWNWCFYAGWHRDNEENYRDWVGRFPPSSNRANPDLISISRGDRWGGENQGHSFFGPACRSGSGDEAGSAEAVFQAFKSNFGVSSITGQSNNMLCFRLQRDQDYATLIGSGAANPTHSNKPDLNRCAGCTEISGISWSGTNLVVTAVGKNEYPNIHYTKDSCSHGASDTGDGCSHILLSESALAFNFTLRNASGGTISTGESSSTCVIDGTAGAVIDEVANPHTLDWGDTVVQGGYVEWPVLGHDPRAKDLICTASYTFENVSETSGTVSAVIRNPSVDNPTWTSETEVCRRNFTQQVQNLTCDNLTATPTTLTTTGGEVTLTARATAQNVTISNYNYGADLNESSLEDGATTSTWTIPAGTASGEYHAWVSVNGGSLTNIGCTGRDTCSQGGERCQVTVRVQSEEEPAFDAQKEASIVCINNNTAARATYTITVRNVSEIAGRILSVTDTYDSRFERSWVGEINPSPDLHEGNILTWNNNGNGWELAGGASLTFTYVVTIPYDHLTTDGSENVFRNVVIVRPEGQDDIQREATVRTSCVPPTGIYDSAVNIGLSGLLMIIIGMIGLRNQEKLHLILLNGFETWPVLRNIRDIFRSRKEKFERRFMKRNS